MADRSAVESIAGFTLSAVATAPAWPPVVTQVVDLLPMLTETFGEIPVVRGQNQLRPSTGQGQSVQIGRVSRGNVNLWPTYNALEHVWAAVLGRMAYSQSGTLLPEEIVPGAYAHTYEIDPVWRSHAWTLDDGVTLDSGVMLNQQIVPHGTYAVDRGDVVWEFAGACLTGVAFSSSPARMDMQLLGIGHSLSLSSVTNPDLSGVPKPAWQDVRHLDLTLRIGTQSTVTALSGADDVAPALFSVSMRHQIATQQRLDSGLYIGHPRRTGVPLVRGRISLPRYSDDVQHLRAIASDQLMIEAVYTGPEIAATGINYELGIYLPSVRLVQPQLPTRAGGRLYDQNYQLQASVPRETYAGMPATIAPSPIIVRLVTDSAVHPLY